MKVKFIWSANGKVWAQVKIVNDNRSFLIWKPYAQI
jgi:hypothetical protein